MHETEMIAVAVVLGQHLPVGRAAMLDPASGQLDLPSGREIAGAIDQSGGGAEVLGKRAAVGAEAREDEAAIAPHAGRVGQPARALVEGGVASGIRDAEKLTVHVVRPSVVGTRECPRVAVGTDAHHGAAMRAPVQEHGHLLVAGPHEDDGLGT